jgi:tRNA/tmRNA/rRNA uracil-C5-methylase (TrmA/RlmC/RlmD family)
MAQSWLGDEFEVTVGAVAHGGHCVARVQGRVLFVRHSLPGETVLARVTEDGGGSFCRADAVAILQPSPDRVVPPCRYAQPGGCGGCDFQHVSLPAQRGLKAQVVQEQLSRLAGIEREVEVEALPGDAAGLGWRRRIRYAPTRTGDLGLRAHRSHEVIPVQRCLLGVPVVGDPVGLRTQAGLRLRPGIEIEAACGDAGDPAILSHTSSPQGKSAAGRNRDKGGRGRRQVYTETRQLAGPSRLDYDVDGRQFSVRPGGFWQTHPAAAATFSAVVGGAAALTAGERAMDLYAGAGLFTALLADAVGPTGAVVGIESDRDAVADARANLSDRPQVGMVQGLVSAASIHAAALNLGETAAIVLDPPRTGAGAQVMAAVLAVATRVVVYVACDPAALARDLRTALEAGWLLADLTAFDAFPMTHHVECIATLRRPA